MEHELLSRPDHFHVAISSHRTAIALISVPERKARACTTNIACLPHGGKRHFSAPVQSHPISFSHGGF